MILDTVRNSTIARTELFFQQRSLVRRRGWRKSLFYTILAMLGAFSFVVGLFSFFLYFPDPDLIRFLLGIFYLLLFVFHFSLMFRTLSLSSGAITRDKRDVERWEALLLTGVSGRDIILGKWWATVRMMWREYLFLAFLRAAAAMTMGGIGYGLTSFVFSYYGRQPVDSSLLNVVIGIVSVFLLTLVNLPFTAACGVMSAMDSKRGSGLVRGFAARASFATLTALTPLLLWWFIGGSVFVRLRIIDSRMWGDVQGFLGYFVGTLLDNGITAASDWISNNYWIQYNALMSFIMFLLSLVAYGGVSWCLLRFAQWRAERGGALKSSEAPIEKFKHETRANA